MTVAADAQPPVLVGHPFAPIGRGEDVRCSYRAFKAAGLTSPIRDVYSLRDGSDRAYEEEFGGHLVRRLSSSVNIFHLNADEVEQALRHIGSDLPSGAHNIIYPQWELSIYPQEWARQLCHFHEIWAPSRFVHDSIVKAVSRPVFHMPLATEVRLKAFLGRRYFGLPEHSYLFLFYFDFSSYIDRKNPFAVIRAFETVASELQGPDARLVIKLNRRIASSEGEAQMRRLTTEIDDSRSKDRIIVIDRLLTDNEIKNLVRCCDCFVSLHRAEGYGRGLAEAMYLGKPVIATSYSGNLDFMSEANSCLVRHTMVEVEEGQYPHSAGQVWAEPDIGDAIQYMRTLLRDRDYGRDLGQVASRYLRTYFSYRASGLRYGNRLAEIVRGSASCR